MRRPRSTAHGDQGSPDVAVGPAVPAVPARRQGARGALDHQVTRFAIVGVFNTIFAFAVFAGLQVTIGERVHYLGVLVLAHILGVLEAFLLQRSLVFRVNGHWWLDLARFWSVYLVALGINAVALPLLVEVVRVPVLPAQAIVMLGTALGTFVAHRRFSFRRPSSATGPSSANDVAGRTPTI